VARSGPVYSGHMTHPLDLSTLVIDTGTIPEPLNRVTQELTELGDDLAIVESFSHSYAWRHDDGLTIVDASGALTGEAVVGALRGWSDAPVRRMIYTHGHIDHVGGSPAFAADADRRGVDRPTVIAHENVAVRMDRYESTNLWNVLINRRQFGGVSADLGMAQSDLRFLPADTLRPDVEVADVLETTLGGERVHFHHARGETDDHLWTEVPDRRWIFSGDFLIWMYPNAGNPQKVQRYALEWATALREMASRGAELLLPAHGLPIAGAERIATVLTTTAATLEDLVRRVLELMNAGATLDTIVHTVTVDEATLAVPYLRPLYDEPEYAVRNIWRLYGGWWDGAASRLKPAPDAVVGAELAALVGGADVLLARALALVETDLRLACHLADFAGWAAPDDPAIHEGRAHVYERRRSHELSLMSKGIYAAAARESKAVVQRASGEAAPLPKPRYTFNLETE
jgi:alkyl sulfatase BDS1-like metallo-beta-lactamase superfamily hydrolase